MRVVWAGGTRVLHDEDRHLNAVPSLPLENLAQVLAEAQNPDHRHRQILSTLELVTGESPR